MVEPSNERSAPAAEKAKLSDLPAHASSSPSRIVTRRQLARTRLGAGRGVVKVDAEDASDMMRPSLVTRRHAWLRRRRRKRILIALAIVLGLFPPMWAVYLLAWIIWRSRPPQRSMRRVHHAVQALEKNRTGIALQQLQEAHLLDPTNNDALYWLGLLLSRQDRQAEAAEALSLVAERVPGLPEVESALVDAYVATDEPESAVYHAQRLLEAAPYAPDTPLKLSIAPAAWIWRSTRSIRLHSTSTCSPTRSCRFTTVWARSAKVKVTRRRPCTTSTASTHVIPPIGMLDRV